MNASTVSERISWQLEIRAVLPGGKKKNKIVPLDVFSGRNVDLVLKKSSRNILVTLIVSEAHIILIVWYTTGNTEVRAWRRA